MCEAFKELVNVGKHERNLPVCNYSGAECHGSYVIYANLLRGIIFCVQIHVNVCMNIDMTKISK